MPKNVWKPQRARLTELPWIVRMGLATGMSCVLVLAIIGAGQVIQAVLKEPPRQVAQPAQPAKKPRKMREPTAQDVIDEIHQAQRQAEIDRQQQAAWQAELTRQHLEDMQWDLEDQIRQQKGQP